MDIGDKKVDIERALLGKVTDFSAKTTVHVHRLFERFDFDEIFGRGAVKELFALKKVMRNLKT